MMSCFFKILRCNLCCEDEVSPPPRQSTRLGDYTRIPNDDLISRAMKPPKLSTIEKSRASPSSSLAKTLPVISFSHITNDPALSSIAPKNVLVPPNPTILSTTKAFASSSSLAKNLPASSASVNSFSPITKDPALSSITPKKDLVPTSKAFISLKSTISSTTEKAKASVSSSSLAKILPVSFSPITKDPALSKDSSIVPSSAAYLSIKPTISLASSSQTSLEKKVNYNWIEKGASATYSCPEDIKSLIEKDIVPEVLKKPLTMSTYKEYFQTLLYAEDIYIEKWNGFEMENVTLKLHKADINMRKNNSKTVKNVEKMLVEFELDKIPKRRPFLLSRDFVTVRPVSNKHKTFQGIIYRVVRSNIVVAEFDENFYSQHKPFGSYDIKFSFNRVCLKRAHQAISDVSKNLLNYFLFPDFIERKILQEKPVLITNFLRSQDCSPPYFVEGPPSFLYGQVQLSETAVYVAKSVLEICKLSSSNKILVCAPTNNTCDMFMRYLKKEIPESDMFRANAAFREWDEVPEDILPSCLYKEKQECFSCPSLKQLSEFKVILSTYMSSFRLHSQGIKAGHFSAIFLVDATSVTEPETLVPLANFFHLKTPIVVSGEPGKRSNWIRSTMAKQHGLSISLFERVRNDEFVL